MVSDSSAHCALDTVTLSEVDCVATWVLSLSLLKASPLTNHQLLTRQKSIESLLGVYSLSPNSGLNQISHCYIKGLSVRKVMRIENMITQVKFSCFVNSFSPLL